MRCLATLLLALLVTAAAPVRADQQPTPAAAPAPGPERYQVFAGELAAGGTIGSLANLTLTGWEVRLGLGGRQPVPQPMSARASWLESVTWLITAGLSRSHTPAGLEVRGLRLGLGARAQGGRLTIGADAEWVQVEIPRVSTGGRLLAQGVGARLLGALDLLQLGPGRALMAYLDGTLDAYGPLLNSGTHNTQLGLHGGIALRW